MTAEQRIQIRDGNDRLRQTFQGGKVLMTCGVQSSGLMAEVLEQVRTFNTFTNDNDPHGEHDYGGFDCGGTRFFWKIDYYDAQLEFFKSPLEGGQRVLTIGKMDEY